MNRNTLLRRTLTWCAALALLGGTAQAQQPAQSETPGTISFQGLISDNAANPIADGNYDITVTLYGDREGREIVWRDQYNAPVVDGLFNLFLGAGNNALPEPTAMDRPLWVGFSIDGSPEMQPLTPLSASPYALNVPDRSITTGKLADGSVTAEKLDMDYVSEVTVDGTRIGGKGTPLRLQGTPSVPLRYDSATGMVVFGVVKETKTDEKGASTLGTTNDYWTMQGDGADYATAALTAPAPGDWIGTANSVVFDIRTFSTSAMRYWANAAGAAPNVEGGLGGAISAGAAASTIAGGEQNSIYGDRNAIGGGFMNLIGSAAAAVNHSVIGGGEDNEVSTDHSVVGGGELNTASGATAFVGGGERNTSSGDYSTIAGGLYNDATAEYSVLVGGRFNTTDAPYGTIGGGQSNLILTSSTHGVIAGGESNRSTGSGAVIAGGRLNWATADYGVIGGGYDNDINETFGTIGGGSDNDIDGMFGTVGGGEKNKVDQERGTIGGGSYNHVVNTGYGSTIGGGDSNIVDGHRVTIAGGWNNDASGDYSTIGGGRFNDVTSVDGTIAGGGGNNVLSDYGVIGGGNGNLVRATAYSSTIAGGGTNGVDGDYSTVGGGLQNTAYGDQSTVAGGSNNNADVLYSTISGGASNDADGDYSTIPGGDNLMTNPSYAQIALGFFNSAVGSIPNRPSVSSNSTYDPPLFMIGNGSYNGGSPIRSNAFEVSYNGHSRVFDLNGSGGAGVGGARSAYTGGTYTDNVVYAWGVVSFQPGPTLVVDADFGVANVVRNAAGWYTVQLNYMNPETGSNSLNNIAVTATLNDNACAIIRVNVPNGPTNTFDVYIDELFSSSGGCSPQDIPFHFQVTGRP